MNRDVVVESCEQVYQGYLSIKRYVLKHTLFAGGMSDAVQREVMDRGEVAAVLVYDPSRDQVLLVEQFRIGAFGRTDNPWLLEIVAGVVEEGETPANVVVREAWEEAGCTLGEVERIAAFYVSPGACTEFAHVFFATADLGDVGGIHGLKEEGEDIAVRVVDRSAAMDLLASGSIQNAKTIIALQWLNLNGEKFNRN